MSGGRHLWSMVDYQQGVLAENIADAPSVSLLISKIIQIQYGRQIVAVVIQKLLCGDRKTYNLIDSTWFYLKIS